MAAILSSESVVRVLQATPEQWAMLHSWIGSRGGAAGAVLVVAPEAAGQTAGGRNEELEDKNQTAEDSGPDRAGAIRSAMAPPCPRYLLRRGLGAWRVIFDGREGEIEHGRGISLVACLLFNSPPGGLHGTELAGMAFGQAVVHEASLGPDGDSTRRLIQRQAKECMAVLQDPLASEMERAEATEQLEELAKALKVTRAGSEGGAEKQVRAVRRAIERLIDKLREAKDRSHDPHRALRAFGEHLHEHLRKPSSRFSGSRRTRTRTEVAGRFTYERPNGIVWEG